MIEQLCLQTRDGGTLQHIPCIYPPQESRQNDAQNIPESNTSSLTCRYRCRCRSRYRNLESPSFKEDNTITFQSTFPEFVCTWLFPTTIYFKLLMLQKLEIKFKNLLREKEEESSQKGLRFLCSFHRTKLPERSSSLRVHWKPCALWLPTCLSSTT